MADLKVCPFCESAKVGQWQAGSCVVCYTCGAEGPMTADHSLSHLDPEEAWNRRATDPRDEVIRQLVGAGSALLHEAHFSMLGGKGHLLDDMDAALAAARQLVRQPYMGQIMAECDCPRQDECQRAGRCIAEGRG